MNAECRCREGISTACVIDAQLKAAAGDPVAATALLAGESRMAQGLTFHLVDRVILDRIAALLLLDKDAIGAAERVAADAPPLPPTAVAMLKRTGFPR